MALDATVGGASSNSYQTRTSAFTLLSDRIGGLAFVALGAAADPYLITATTILNSLEYTGQATTETQALQFPRIGMYNWNRVLIPSDIIPRELALVHAELAFSLFSSNTTQETVISQIGLTDLKAGPVSLSFNRELRFKQIPDNVWALFPPGWLVLDTVSSGIDSYVFRTV